MAKINKTNAMRILDAQKIEHNVLEYKADDGKIDGISVAKKIGRSMESVFKTLVLKGNSDKVYVAVVPVKREVNLKKLANEVGEKRIVPIHVNEILSITGYIRGGCSPIGMKKKYETIIDKSVKNNDMVIVSGGKIGLQIELHHDDLIKLTEARVIDIT